MLARIFRPARTAMQSGKAAALNWVLEYEPERRPAADPLMGYTSTTDMRRQIRLEFATREEAVRVRAAQRHSVHRSRRQGARAEEVVVLRQFPHRPPRAMDALALRSTP